MQLLPDPAETRPTRLVKPLLTERGLELAVSEWAKTGRAIL
jgi:hypothetical protein